jgi:hypothetical protein
MVLMQMAFELREGGSRSWSLMDGVAAERGACWLVVLLVGTSTARCRSFDGGLAMEHLESVARRWPFLAPQPRRHTILRSRSMPQAGQVKLALLSEEPSRPPVHTLLHAPRYTLCYSPRRPPRRQRPSGGTTPSRQCLYPRRRCRQPHLRRLRQRCQRYPQRQPARWRWSRRRSRRSR